jgi:hypothetical protein
MRAMDKIEIPRKTLEKLLEIVQSHGDLGPPGEEWKSPELIELINEARKLLGEEPW